jgi:uncharacterized membrane protein YkoI
MPGLGRSIERDVWGGIRAPGVDPLHGLVKPFFVELREPTLKGSFIRGSDWLADNPAVNALRPTTHDRRHAKAWRHARLKMALASLLLIGLVQPSAWGSDSRDHERARTAVQAGQVLPLPTLLERLRRTHPGQVLELELERDDGRWIYEIKLLQATGQLLQLDVDAATAQVLQVKRKDGGKDRRKAERDSGRQVTPSKEPPR